MLTAAQNAVLTETGPDTLMGKVFRNYWMPALLSRELADPDCSPMRIKLLGEDFVAFRDSEGRVGIVEPRSSHRGANLFFGRNEDCGLRCVYHGWKFDVNGNCIDIPTSPPDIAEKVKPQAAIRALPTREFGDVIWAYLGEGDAPELPQFEFAAVPAEHRFVSKKFQQCNWAQACEGGLDTAHFSFLHGGVEDGKPVSLMNTFPDWTQPKAGTNEPPNIACYRWMANDPMPQFTVIQHDAGLVLCAARNADGDEKYWRLSQFLMPNHSLLPGNWPGAEIKANTWVPIDDTSCWIFCYAWNPHRPITDEERERWAGGFGVFAEVDEHYHPICNRENDYLIDRDLQRESHFTGIAGVSEQDAAIADSQGLIADRTRELLGQTDLGVVRFRQMVLNAVEAVASGERPHGADAAHAYAVHSGETLAAADAHVLDVLDERLGEQWGFGADR